MTDLLAATYPWALAASVLLNLILFLTLAQEIRARPPAARNAFAAQMEFGWGVYRDVDGWVVSGILGMIDSHGDFVEAVMQSPQPDPVSAILEARRLYRLHVEKESPCP